MACMTWRHIAPMILLSVVPCLSSPKKVLSERGYAYRSTGLLGVPSFKLAKIKDPVSGDVIVESTAPSVAATHTDIARLNRAQALEHRGAEGNLCPSLSSAIKTSDPQDTLPVLVCLRRPPNQSIDRSLYSAEQLGAHEEALAEPEASALVRALAERSRPRFGNPRGIGRAFATEATVEELSSLASDATVAAVMLRGKPKPTTDITLTELAQQAYNPSPLPYGVKGFGVRVATVEAPLLQYFVERFPGTDPNRVDYWPIGPDGYSREESFDWQHANTMYKIVVHAAPDATMYHFGGAIEQKTSQIVDNGIEVASSAWGPVGSDRDVTNMIIDELAYDFPAPVVCLTAGNDGWLVEPLWQARNALVVGAGKYQDGHYVYYRNTSSLNPPGDRELPHIIGMASGRLIDDPLETFLLSLPCGSSSATSGIAGIAANVLSANSRMRCWPEKVRAALLLTGQNVYEGEWNCAVDGEDGVGVVSGHDAVWFAVNHTAVTPYGEAVHGLSAGSIYKSDSYTHKMFYIRMPQQIQPGTHLRIVCTWDSSPDLTTRYNAVTDMDIEFNPYVYTHARGSWSFDDNVEVIDVPANELYPGDLVPLKMYIWHVDIPSGASDPNLIYYALGWTWVRDHAK